MALLFANNATSRIRIDIPAGSTTVTVAPGDGAKFPNPVAPDFFTLTLEDRRSGQIEIMSCTARSGDILTVTRAQEGTTAQDFVIGATAANRLTAASLTALQNLADAYTKAQSDAKFVDAAGDTMTGPLALPAGAPTLGPQATNKTYVDAQVATKANVAHTHPESDVINLVADLAARPTEAPSDSNPYARRNVAWVATITKVAYDIDIAQIRTDINTNATNIAANTTVNNTQDTRLNALETTIATKEDKSAKGAVSGYAPLDATGKVPAANLPPIAAPGTYVPQTGSTGAGNLPSGTIAQRPTAAQGLIRFNTETLTFEGNNGTIWSGIGGGVTVSLTPPTPAKQGDLWWKSDSGLMYIYYDDGNTQQWVVATPNQDITGLDTRYVLQTSRLPRSYLAGLTLSNNVTTPNTQIDVAAGTCRDDTNVADLVLPAGTINFSTVGANGLDAGSPVQGFYHCFAIGKADGTVARLGSLSLAAPTMPSGYIYKRRLGSVRFNATPILNTFFQKGDEFYWSGGKFGDLSISGTGTGAAWTSFALTVPPGLVVSPLLSGFLQQSAAAGAIDLQLDSMPQVTTSNQIYAAYSQYASQLVDFTIGMGMLYTDTSQRIAYRTAIGGGTPTMSPLSIYTRGWLDRRGRDD